jgi:cytidylate kinase
MEAIIISGLPAVGKTTVAKMIGRKYRLRVLGGGDVLKEMASESGYSVTGEGWWDTHDGIRFLQERKQSPDFDKEVDLRLLKKTESGNVVITSYPLPWLTQHGIKFWLNGSEESRARRMSKRDKIPYARCMEVIKIRDRENYRIYKQIYNIDFGKDLSVFDLVVNTDRIPASVVAARVTNFLEARVRHG